jgi:hypothetical protein
LFARSSFVGADTPFDHSFDGDLNLGCIGSGARVSRPRATEDRTFADRSSFADVTPVPRGNGRRGVSAPKRPNGASLWRNR